MRRLTTTVTTGAAAFAVLGSLAVAVPAGAATPPAPGTAGGTAAGAAQATAAGGTTGRIRWTKCPDAADPFLHLVGAVCGFVSVPLDHSKPAGTKIKLAVSMVKRTTKSGKRYQGVMLTNPGGPGGSGLALPVLSAFEPRAGVYDWIGFDPRGVGASVPSLRCAPERSKAPLPSPEPVTPAIEAKWLQRAKSYAKACGRAGGALLSHMKTTDWAKDMDYIRAALGVKQINYYGFSYGSYLGQVYATLYPQRVRRMVLDGNVDPTRVWYRGTLDQNIAFERTMKLWFSWLARHHRAFGLGASARAVERRFYTERAALARKPAGGVIGASEWTEIFIQAAYNEITWVDLGKLWAAWNTDRTKPAPLVEAYKKIDTPSYQQMGNAYNAVTCTDAPWPTSFATWRKDAWASHARAPYTTWSNTWGTVPCLFWPARPGTPITVDGSKTPPILLVNETLDAPTPFQNALAVRKHFPRSRLLAVLGGANHSGSLPTANACERTVIWDYLTTGRLPVRAGGNRADVACKRSPLPDPNAKDPFASSAGEKAAALREQLTRVPRPTHLTP